MKDDVVKSEVDVELEEFGAVSEQTRGGFFGWYWDGGFGKRI